MTRRIRIIPILLLKGDGLYKTIQFKRPNYIGDPINAVKIFNEKGVDEIILLDIAASSEGRPINFPKITEIAGEAFMPMAYGGGIASFEHAQKVFDAGYEKVVINSAGHDNKLLEKIAHTYGSQSVVISIDAQKNWLGKYKVYTHSGTKSRNLSPDKFAQQAVAAGAGEVMINSIDKDGTWGGYDLVLIRLVSGAVQVPVIACGGAGCMEDFKQAVLEGNASAVAAGSMFVYQKKGMGVLINVPAETIRV